MRGLWFLVPACCRKRSVTEPSAEAGTTNIPPSFPTTVVSKTTTIRTRRLDSPLQTQPDLYLPQVQQADVAYLFSLQLAFLRVVTLPGFYQYQSLTFLRLVAQAQTDAAKPPVARGVGRRVANAVTDAQVLNHLRQFLIHVARIGIHHFAAGRCAELGHVDAPVIGIFVVARKDVERPGRRAPDEQAADDAAGFKQPRVDLFNSRVGEFVHRGDVVRDSNDDAAARGIADAVHRGRSSVERGVEAGADAEVRLFEQAPDLLNHALAIFGEIL